MQTIVVTLAVLSMVLPGTNPALTAHNNDDFQPNFQQNNLAQIQLLKFPQTTPSVSLAEHPRSTDTMYREYKRIKRRARKNHKRSKSENNVCAHAPNKQLCLPKSYSKFELPFTDSVNVVEIGIDISDVLRINDKVCVWLFTLLASWFISIIEMFFPFPPFFTGNCSSTQTILSLIDTKKKWGSATMGPKFRRWHIFQ